MDSVLATYFRGFYNTEAKEKFEVICLNISGLLSFYLPLSLSLSLSLVSGLTGFMYDCLWALVTVAKPLIP